ncbi:MAG TPA: mechanosensitive ion channel protein MscS, partial [Candidatus Cloacimonas sp.]|nr:mechanosensitive ion channel protein MscS [Candidatus Cloacimonas sp.]
MDKIVDANFWQQLFINSKSWIINELPGLLIALLLFFVANRLLKFFTKKVKKGLILHAERQGKQDKIEASKRIETLTSIIHGFIKIILWVVLLMIILQKLGINIAPILAGAGIVGLAVGFGAQELVRDFISGFFIILENQIRAGDVAII